MHEDMRYISHSSFLTGVGDSLCINDSVQRALARNEGTKEKPRAKLSGGEKRDGRSLPDLSHHLRV